MYVKIHMYEGTPVRLYVNTYVTIYVCYNKKEQLLFGAALFG